MNYPPTVYIADFEIQCDFLATGSNVVVLDGLSIEWGRDGLYDPTNPSELTMTLLDPTGVYASDPALFGQPVRVETSQGVLFRGRIDGIEIAPIAVDEQNPNVPPEIWEATITASDVIADLAKIIAPGYEKTMDNLEQMAYPTEYGPGFWCTNTTEDRRAEIQRRIAERGFPTVVETVDFNTISKPGVYWRYYFIEGIRSSGDDLYTMVQSVQLRADTPAHTNYLPGRDALTAGRFPQTVSLILTYRGSVIRIEPETVAGQVAIAVECNTVSIDDDASVTATIENNIGYVRINQSDFHWGPTQNWGSAGAPAYRTIESWSDAVPIDTTISSPGGAKGSYEPSPVIVGYQTTTYGGTVAVAPSQTAQEFGATIGEWIAAVNGKITPPPITFDLETETYDPAVITAMLATWTNRVAFTFPGSRFETLTGWGPAFQLIGGTLVFEQGWQITGRFAPSRAGGAGTLTISELVTTDPPTFDQYADSVTLAGLGTVTRGI